MPYTLPSDVDKRPIAIDGGGTLGRRIACVFAAGGTDVRIFDPSAEQLESARAFVLEDIGHTQQVLGLHPSRIGEVAVSDDLEQVVRGAWMVIEAVPEQLELKTGGLRPARPARGRRRDPGQQLLIAADQPAHRQGRAPGARAEHALHAAPRAERARVDVVRQDRRGHHRRAHGQLPRYGLLPFRVRGRERRVHLQPHLGLDQARVPDGGRGGRGVAGGRRRHVEDLHRGRYSAVPHDGPGGPRRHAGHRGALRSLSGRPSPMGRAALLRGYIDQGRLGEKSGRGFYEYSS